MSGNSTTTAAMTTSLDAVDSNVTITNASSTTTSSSPVTTTISTTMTPYPSTKLEPEDEGMSGGVIAGIVVGTIVVVLVIAVATFYIMYRRKRQIAKNREKKPEEILPSTDELDRMDKEKLNTTKKKSKKSKKHKSSSKRNKYEKESASVISVDPSSMPSFIAPEPPSTHAYANQSFNYANLQQKAGKDYSNESDGYERQKPNTAKLYSTTYGADYYVVGDEKGSQKAKQSKYQNSQRNNPDLSASVVSNDYENLKDKPKNPRDMRNSSPEDPQDVYEPIDQPS